MVTITQFFDSLDRKIRQARTTKALKVLDKRARKFIKNQRNSTDKSKAIARYRKSQDLMRRRVENIS